MEDQNIVCGQSRVARSREVSSCAVVRKRTPKQLRWECERHWFGEGVPDACVSTSRIEFDDKGVEDLEIFVELQIEIYSLDCPNVPSTSVSEA